MLLLALVLVLLHGVDGGRVARCIMVPGPAGGSGGDACALCAALGACAGPVGPTSCIRFSGWMGWGAVLLLVLRAVWAGAPTPYLHLPLLQAYILVAGKHTDSPYVACLQPSHEVNQLIQSTLPLQAYFLVADDIMDSSITRRGQPCWYRQPKVRGWVGMDGASGGRPSAPAATAALHPLPLLSPLALLALSACCMWVLWPSAQALPIAP